MNCPESQIRPNAWLSIHGKKHLTINIHDQWNTNKTCSVFRVYWCNVWWTFCMKNHITMITQKLSEVIGIVNWQKDIYPQQALRSIYNVLFLNSIWHMIYYYGTIIFNGYQNYRKYQFDWVLAVILSAQRTII